MPVAEPIAEDELAALFAPVAGAPADPCALAVSGGSDSTALMVLFADWLAQSGVPPSRHWVLTVDHRLRPESAAEARAVADRATGLGFRHASLAWDGKKPATGLQAAARDARYRLMAGHMRAHGVALLLTAHTADDQAETLLMRLARGSGLDGLSSMAPLALMETAPDLMVGRPLLGLNKDRLRATLQRRGVSWIEDPSNTAPQFERTRLRTARAELDALGLTPDRLQLSARRLQRARAAIEAEVDRFCRDSSTRVSADPHGVVRIDRSALAEAADEIAIRVLIRAVAAAGGSDQPVPLAAIEAIAAALRARPDAGAGWTIARAIISVASADTIVVLREADRAPLPRGALAPEASLVWDGRFRVTRAAKPGGSVDVGPLGAEGLAMVRAAGITSSDAPPAALRALPAFRIDGQLIAVPTLDHWPVDAWRAALAAVFTGADRYNLRLQLRPPR